MQRIGEELMRTFVEKTGEMSRVICNRRGRELRVKQGAIREGVFHGETCFGYDSRKDGTRQSFDLCEDCYDELCRSFLIPVEVEEQRELL